MQVIAEELVGMKEVASLKFSATNLDKKVSFNLLYNDTKHKLVVCWTNFQSFASIILFSELKPIELSEEINLGELLLFWFNSLCIVDDF